MIDYQLLELQNPWWEEKGAINRDEKIEEYESLKYKRDPVEIFKLPLVPKAVHLITGPRQTGKSTALKLYIRLLLQKKFPAQNILFFSCDALSTPQEVIDLILQFQKLSEDKKLAVFLDEISSVTNWPQAIKWLADGGFLKNSTFFLTGSSSIQLKKSGEFLPGRRGEGKDVHFLPITFKDYLLLKQIEIKKRSWRNLAQIEKCFQEFLVQGGFLRNINYGVALGLPIYLATLRSELYKASKKEDFLREVIRKILSSLSSTTSYTNIAEEAELGSKNTAIEYLSFLADSFFLKEVKFYQIQQQRPILKKNKKFYTIDPYLIWLLNSFITGSSDLPALARWYQASTEKAKIIENYVASELYKSGVDFYYSHNLVELDFYLPKEKLALEVKYKSKITKADLNSFELKGLPKKVKRIVVTKDTQDSLGKIVLIPAHLLTLADFWPQKQI